MEVFWGENLSGFSPEFMWGTVLVEQASLYPVMGECSLAHHFLFMKIARNGENMVYGRHTRGVFKVFRVSF